MNHSSLLTEMIRSELRQGANLESGRLRMVNNELILEENNLGESSTQTSEENLPTGQRRDSRARRVSWGGEVSDSARTSLHLTDTHVLTDQSEGKKSQFVSVINSYQWKVKITMLALAAV